MKRSLLPLFFLFAAVPVFSQLASDVLRYSYLQPGGTARYLGAGGAFGALGAEYSSLSNNPAGLAMFRSNELVITPSLKFSNTEAGLPGAGNITSEDTKSNFGFDNFGFIFHLPTRSTAKWKTFNIGIGLNRLNNFHQSVYYEGTANGTIMEGFFNDASKVINNGGTVDDLDPFGAQLAFNGGGIYTQNGVLSYDFIDNANASVNRSQTLTTTGRMNEMVLSFAGNYDEKLMLGATVGVPFVNYKLDGEYQESDPGGGLDGNVQYFNALSYTEFLKTEGVGVNLKLGLTYRVTQALRLGLAFHTPTYLALTDRYSNTFSYDYEDGGGAVLGDVQSSPEGVSDYRLRTPWRAIGSAAVVIKKYGFVSADVELVDYSANAFNFTADLNTADNKQAEREENNLIQRSYRQTTNIRVGGELALDDFRLRAGVNLLGKPEADATGFNMAYTAGAGIHGESFYLDLGYRLSKGKGSVSPYATAPVATTNTVNNELLVTLGFKF